MTGAARGCSDQGSELRIWDGNDMDDINLSPEELIAGMAPEEICELLAEMGMDATVSEAAAIQGMVAEFGSIEAAFEALADEDRSIERRAA